MNVLVEDNQIVDISIDLKIGDEIFMIFKQTRNSECFTRFGALSRFRFFGYIYSQCYDCSFMYCGITYYFTFYPNLTLSRCFRIGYYNSVRREYTINETVLW